MGVEKNSCEKEAETSTAATSCTFGGLQPSILPTHHEHGSQIPIHYERKRPYYWRRSVCEKRECRRGVAADLKNWAIAPCDWCMVSSPMHWKGLARRFDWQSTVPASFHERFK